MAGEVVSPRVQIADVGSPFVTDPMVMQANANMSRGITEAAQMRQAVMLQQLNAEKAMELAKWQHQSQMERATVNYNRFLDQQRLKGQQAMEQIKGKSDAATINELNTNLQRYGAQPIGRNENESNADYVQRLGKAAVEAKAQAIAKDSAAATHWDEQRQLQEDTKAKLLAQPPVKAELDTAMQNLGVHSQASNYVAQNFSGWLNKVAPESADIIQAALQRVGSLPADQIPAAQQLVLKKAGVLDKFQDFQNSALQDEAYKFLKAAGSPNGKTLATLNDGIKYTQDRYNSILMTEASGNTGRQVRKSYASDIENAVQDAQQEKRNAAIKAAQAAPANTTPDPSAPKTPNAVTLPPTGMAALSDPSSMAGMGAPPMFPRPALTPANAPIMPTMQWIRTPTGFQQVPVIDPGARTNGVMMGGSMYPYGIPGVPRPGIAPTNAPAAMPNPITVPPILPGPRGVSVAPDISNGINPMFVPPSDTGGNDMMNFMYGQRLMDSQ